MDFVEHVYAGHTIVFPGEMWNRPISQIDMKAIANSHLAIVIAGNQQVIVFKNWSQTSPHYRAMRSAFPSTGDVCTNRIVNDAPQAQGSMAEYWEKRGPWKYETYDHASTGVVSMGANDYVLLMLFAR